MEERVAGPEQGYFDGDRSSEGLPIVHDAMPDAGSVVLIKPIGRKGPPEMRAVVGGTRAVLADSYRFLPEDMISHAVTDRWPLEVDPDVINLPYGATATRVLTRYDNDGRPHSFTLISVSTTGRPKVDATVMAYMGSFEVPSDPEGYVGVDAHIDRHAQLILASAVEQGLLDLPVEYRSQGPFARIVLDRPGDKPEMVGRTEEESEARLGLFGRLGQYAMRAVRWMGGSSSHSPEGRHRRERPDSLPTIVKTMGKAVLAAALLTGVVGGASLVKPLFANEKSTDMDANLAGPMDMHDKVYMPPSPRNARVDSGSRLESPDRSPEAPQAHDVEPQPRTVDAHGRSIWKISQELLRKSLSKAPTKAQTAKLTNEIKRVNGISSQEAAAGAYSVLDIPPYDDIL